MIHEIYGIYDDASESYVQILPCLNEKLAKMTFETLFKQKRLNVPMLYDYPNCYRAYKLATYDDNKGCFENIQPEFLLDFGGLVQTT